MSVSIKTSRLVRSPLAALALFCCLPSMAASPVELIEQFQEALEQAALTQAGTYEERSEQLQPVIERTHDLPFIARLTLGFQWNDLDDSQRDRFVARFSELSVANYASRFGALGGSALRIVEDQAQPRGRHLVRAELARRDGQPVSFDYLLHETAAGWRIVNILVDGVSELALKRAEYAKILREQDFDALLATLSAQTERLTKTRP